MILKLNIATKSDLGTYSYDANKKHAITQVLCNDYNYTGDYQQITYNSYNKATAINNYLFVSYGTDNQHIRTQTKSGSTVLKTKYFSGSYEKIIEGTTVKELHYISCDYGLIAIYEKNSHHLYHVLYRKRPFGQHKPAYKPRRHKKGRA